MPLAFGTGMAHTTSNVPAPEETALARAAEGSRRLRFLVADDAGVNRRIAALVLEHRGHSVRTAIDGGEALEILQREPFDCVLMDVHMPGVDGLEATRRIRERERETGAHLAILAMTADTLAADIDRCRDAGMDDCVSKPMEPGETIAAALRVIDAPHAAGAHEANVATELRS